MRFPPSLLDEIRARLPISQVVGRKVSWDKRKTQPGRGDYWACCPFHSEKTPSFHAEDRKGRYHCFGCGVSGDIFTFLIETEGVNFPEAVEQFAGEAGVALPAPDPQSQAREARRASLYDVMELAASFFEDRLQTGEGAKARGYLSERGLRVETQQAFRLGYAPNARHELKQFLASKNISQDQMIAAGLLIAGEEIPAPYDRFRGRIMFPIADARGRIIAFGGRALDPDQPAKYLNSPETDLFDKGSVLYNLAPAREAARKAGAVIAVEGYMDVIALHAAGFGHALAPLGTALTDRQIALMWRINPEPVLCFDGDGAGIKAAQRALDTALPHLKPGYSLKFALLPDGQDPDDLLRAEGSDALAAVLAAAKPAIDMLWAREVEAQDLSTPERRAGLEARLRQITGEIQDNDVRRHYETALRMRLRELWQPQTQARGRNDGRNDGRGGKDYERAYDRGRMGERGDYGARRFGQNIRARLGPSTATRASALGRGGSNMNRREYVLVYTVLNHPVLLEQYAEEFGSVEFSIAELDSLRNGILEIAARRDTLDKQQLADDLKASRWGAAVDRLETAMAALSEWFSQADAAEQDAETGFRHVLALHRKSLTLKRELKAAERELAANPTDENVAVLLDLTRQLESAEGSEANVEGYGEASERRAASDF